MRLDISYDGRDFAGWARQKDLRTVQGDLERVLSQILRARVSITCAGRTDAGVHARGQVAHLDVDLPEWDPYFDASRINRALPDDVRVWTVTQAPLGFDARFSALWRRYSYRVSDDPSGPDPLVRHMSMPWFRRLDLDLMNEAGQGLVGEHEFTAFCKYRERATSIREIAHLRWERELSGAAVLHIQADAFCRSMVRSIVGSLLPVGDGRKSVDWPAEVLAGRARTPWVAVMPAYPLVLEEVGYPPDHELEARQAITRTMRSAGTAVVSD
jgi:tRNA pseudouridine38-40 synthase